MNDCHNRYVIIFFWHNYLLNFYKKHNIMKDDPEEYVEPPELRKEGFFPLKKWVKNMFIGIAVILVVVTIISIIFWLSNKR